MKVLPGLLDVLDERRLTDIHRHGIRKSEQRVGPITFLALWRDALAGFRFLMDANGKDHVEQGYCYYCGCKFIRDDAGEEILAAETERLLAERELAEVATSLG